MVWRGVSLPIRRTRESFHLPRILDHFQIAVVVHLEEIRPTFLLMWQIRLNLIHEIRTFVMNNKVSFLNIK